MIKLRVMGEEKDLDWVLRLLEAHEDVKVISSSSSYAMNGTSRYRRRYIEIEKEKQNTEGMEGKMKNEHYIQK